SQSAYEAFTLTQLNQLATHGKLLPFAVPTIETIGGGSVRCMLAELFLPKQA
ncbi:amidinotransferase, partial [Vibrio cholerae]